MKILFLDLETSPHQGYSYGPKYETSIIKYTRHGELLSVAWKWLGKKKLHGVKRVNYVLGTDKPLAEALWKAMDEADVIIGHNIDKFDKRTANTYFAKFNLPPPSNYFTIDTLKVVRKNFALPSYKLDDVCQYFGLGKKLGTGGFDLWDACMNSDIKALEKMLRYNKHDVFLLEPLYNFLLPWIPNHPNMALINDRPGACPICLHTKFKSIGWRYTKTQKYRRFRCTKCQSVIRENKGAMPKGEKVMVSV